MNLNQILDSGYITQLQINQAPENFNFPTMQTFNYETKLAKLIEFEKLNNDYQSDLSKRLELRPCIGCLQLYKSNYLRKINTNLNAKQQQIVDTLIHFNSKTDPLFCSDHYYKDIVTQNHEPILSRLNDCYLGEIPNEIKNLNMFERMLCQQYKCLLSVTHLNGFNKQNYTRGLPALQGLAVHLPLSFDFTNQFLVNTLPNYDGLNILIDGLPTKNNFIWRHVINLDKVYKALIWLKLNNVEYKNVIIENRNMIKLYRSLQFVKNDDPNYHLVEDKSNLKTHDNLPTLKQYTVYDFDKANKYEADIKKYMSKKIENTPLDTKDKKLDILCFPEIFPYGKAVCILIVNLKFRPLDLRNGPY